MILVIFIYIRDRKVYLLINITPRTIYMPGNDMLQTCKVKFSAILLLNTTTN